MQRILALAGFIALTAGVASAGDRPVGLSLQFTLDPTFGSPWSDDIEAAAGGTVFVRVVMTIPDTAYGIAGARYNIASLPGQWDVAGDDRIDLTPGKGVAWDGRRSYFDFGGQTQQVFEAANRLRIDAKGDINDSTSAGISTSQNTPAVMGDLFNPQKSVWVYRFAIILGSAPMVRDLSLVIADGDQNGDRDEITSFKAYEHFDSTAGVQLSGAVGDTGTIHIVPVPSAGWIAASAIAWGGRRGRRVLFHGGLSLPAPAHGG